MKKFWSQTIEVKAMIISLVVTLLGFMGTLFLFWLHRYDIPLAILVSGMVVFLTWLCLYFSRRSKKPNVRIDIVLIYLRLGAIVALAILFTALELSIGLVTISPIALVASYLVLSLATLIAYYRKGENDV